MMAIVEQGNTALWMFLAFVAATLVITYFSARKSSGASAYFAAGRRITGWQNGLAVAGDYMSAASFLGIAGMIAMNGYDGFLYSVSLKLSCKVNAWLQVVRVKKQKSARNLITI